ncbi:MAG: hypothetical protein WCP68_13750 [Enhydrobacter sp.]
MLVKGIHNLADQVAVSILAQLLCDRHQPDAGFEQFADIELGVHRVATEAAEGMHGHDIVGTLGRGRTGDHLLEYRAVFVESRRAGLGEGVDDGPLLAFAIVPELLDLVR